MDRVGIIGVGLVGTALAERLIAANYSIIGFDQRAEQMTELVRIGGEAACCAGDVASNCKRILLSLPTSEIAGAVLAEILPKLSSGAIVIDTTTGAPEDAMRFGSMLKQAGFEYLDATIGGSSRQVRIGEAIFLCGGSKDGFARCEDLWAHCCKTAHYVGPVGSGARMKLVMNLVLGLNRAVLAEGLEFARASGIDPHIALEILKTSPAYSRAMDTKGQRMLNEEFEPEARLSQHLKDVLLILASGEQFDARLPLSEAHRQLLEEAVEAGYGAADNSAVIKAFQKIKTT